MSNYALPAAAAAFFAATLGVPAVAQDGAAPAIDDSYNMVIVYGDDACPQSTDEQIVVCARKSEGERYRIPEDLRYSTDPANRSWAARVETFEMVGAFGTMSCSPVGAGGYTGCTQEMIRNAYADKDAAATVRFSQIIERLRQERLGTIDAEAEQTQRDVEMIEREYMQRLERERAAELPDEQAPPPVTPSAEGDD